MENKQNNTQKEQVPQEQPQTSTKQQLNIDSELFVPGGSYLTDFLSGNFDQQRIKMDNEQQQEDMGQQLQISQQSQFQQEQIPQVHQQNNHQQLQNAMGQEQQMFQQPQFQQEQIPQIYEQNNQQQPQNVMGQQQQMLEQSQQQMLEQSEIQQEYIPQLQEENKLQHPEMIMDQQQQMFEKSQLQQNSNIQMHGQNQNFQQKNNEFDEKHQPKPQQFMNSGLNKSDVEIDAHGNDSDERSFSNYTDDYTQEGSNSQNGSYNNDNDSRDSDTDSLNEEENKVKKQEIAIQNETNQKNLGNILNFQLIPEKSLKFKFKGGVEQIVVIPNNKIWIIGKKGHFATFDIIKNQMIDKSQGYIDPYEYFVYNYGSLDFPDFLHYNKDFIIFISQKLHKIMLCQGNKVREFSQELWPQEEKVNDQEIAVCNSQEIAFSCRRQINRQSMYQLLMISKQGKIKETQQLFPPEKYFNNKYPSVRVKYLQNQDICLFDNFSQEQVGIIIWNYSKNTIKKFEVGGKCGIKDIVPYKGNEICILYTTNQISAGDYYDKKLIMQIRNLNKIDILQDLMIYNETDEQCIIHIVMVNINENFLVFKIFFDQGYSDKKPKYYLYCLKKNKIISSSICLAENEYDLSNLSADQKHNYMVEFKNSDEEDQNTEIVLTKIGYLSNYYRYFYLHLLDEKEVTKEYNRLILGEIIEQLCGKK